MEIPNICAVCDRMHFLCVVVAAATCPAVSILFVACCYLRRSPFSDLRSNSSLAQWNVWYECICFVFLMVSSLFVCACVCVEKFKHLVYIFECMTLLPALKAHTHTHTRTRTVFHRIFIVVQHFPSQIFCGSCNNCFCVRFGTSLDRVDSFQFFMVHGNSFRIRHNLGIFYMFYFCRHYRLDIWTKTFTVLHLCSSLNPDFFGLFWSRTRLSSDKSANTIASTFIMYNKNWPCQFNVHFDFVPFFFSHIRIHFSQVSSQLV